MKKLIILLVIGVGCFIAYKTFLAPNPLLVTRANFDKIDEGMSESQLRRMLGKPTAVAGEKFIEFRDGQITGVYHKTADGKRGVLWQANAHTIYRGKDTTWHSSEQPKIDIFVWKGNGDRSLMVQFTRGKPNAWAFVPG